MTATNGQTADAFNTSGAPLPDPDNNVSGMLGPVRNPRSADNDPDAAAAAAVENMTSFLEALKALARVQSIPTKIADILHKDIVTIDSSKEAVAGTIYAKFGDAAVTITANSISTDGEMTPELAYQMAAAGSMLFETVELTGDIEQKAMLFWAAKQFNLSIDEASIPQIPIEMVGPLRKKLVEYEVRMGLPNVVDDCFDGLKKEPKPKPPKSEPAADTRTSPNLDPKLAF